MSKFKVTLRRNGKPVGEMSYPSEAVAVTQAKAMKDATGCAVTVAPAGAAKANRRRNGATIMWTVRVGSQEIGDLHAAPRLTAALVRKAAKLAAEQGITAKTFKRLGSVSNGMTRYLVAPFIKNGHLCNPGCGCSANPRRNGASEFAFDEHFQRLYTRSHPGAIWEKAPHHKGGSPAAYLRQIEALVADGSMSTGTAALLRKQMKDAGFVPQSNPRRRNGTSSANIAASTSLVHRAHLLRNSAIEIG